MAPQRTHRAGSWAIAREGELIPNGFAPQLRALQTRLRDRVAGRIADFAGRLAAK